VSTQFYQRPDGRVLCADCHTTAVYDPAEAERLFIAIRQTVAQVLGLELNIGATLHLVNRQQIAALRQTAPLTPRLPFGLGQGPPVTPVRTAEEDTPQPARGTLRVSATREGNPAGFHNPQGEPSGLPHAEDDNPDLVGLFVHVGRLRAIYVEYGLPRIFFSEVVAHEYAHAWQAENAPLLADAELREGFAEWVAYKVMESWGCRLRLERFRARQDLYGAGLRRVLGWEAAGGVDEVLERIRRA
jgi:hypothetical protein